MKWSDLRVGSFVHVWFKDHCEIWDPEEPGTVAPANADFETDPGGVIDVLCKGQVTGVWRDGPASDHFIELEGSWNTGAERSFGTYRILRSAIRRLAAMP